jgi:molecular chaperone GrpE
MSPSRPTDDRAAEAFDAALAEQRAAGPHGVPPKRPDGAEGDAPPSAGEPAAAERLAALQRELDGQRDRNLRLCAEIENLRTRAARELAEQQKYAVLPLARDLLPVVDNVDRAIEAAAKDAEAGGLLEGFRMVRQQLSAALARHQCEPIDADGQAFDPQCHEAIAQYPSDVCPPQHVLQVVQQGYRLHDRVVRAAQVIVSAGAAAGSAAHARSAGPSQE